MAFSTADSPPASVPWAGAHGIRAGSAPRTALCDDSAPRAGLQVFSTTDRSAKGPRFQHHGQKGRGHHGQVFLQGERWFQHHGQFGRGFGVRHRIKYSTVHASVSVWRSAPRTAPQPRLSPRPSLAAHALLSRFLPNTSTHPHPRVSECWQVSNPDSCRV